MTAIRDNGPTAARPAWREVLRSTLRSHRVELLVAALTVLFVVAFAIAGYALTRYGSGS